MTHRVVTVAECIAALVGNGYEKPKMTLAIAIALGRWIMVGDEWLYISEAKP